MTASFSLDDNWTTSKSNASASDLVGESSASSVAVAETEAAKLVLILGLVLVPGVGIFFGFPSDFSFALTVLLLVASSFFLGVFSCFLLVPLVPLVGLLPRHLFRF